MAGCPVRQVMGALCPLTRHGKTTSLVFSTPAARIGAAPARGADPSA